MDLYVVEPGPSTTPRRLKEVSGDWSIADWSPDDRHVAAVEYISANESYVHLVDVALGRDQAAHAPRRAGGGDGQLWRRPLRRATAARSTGRPTSTRSSAASSATTWRPASPRS